MNRRPKYAKEALCSFANSAMAVEFVYIILLGINSFMDNLNVKKEQQKQDDNKISINLGPRTTTIVFDTIKFKNLATWDIERSAYGIRN